jgi:hypothetical protein
MRIITAYFAHAPQRCTSRTSMHFLLMFQEVRPISKTCNQLGPPATNAGKFTVSTPFDTLGSSAFNRGEAYL